MSVDESSFKKFYNYWEMNNTCSYWKEMKEIEPVANLKSVIDDIYTGYKAEMKVLEEQHQVKYDKLVFKYLKNSKLKEMWKKIVIGLFIGFVILGILSFFSGMFFLRLLYSLIKIFVFSSGCIFLVIYCMEKLSSKRYFRYDSNIQQQSSLIYNKYAQQARLLYSQIDNLYLESLDPMQRELILTKRELKETNKHMVSMQKQMANDNKKLRKQLDNAQNVIVDIRREAAETNEKMRVLTKWFHLD